MARAIENEVFKIITQDKWIKAKTYITEVKERLGNKDKSKLVEQKFLKRVCSYLNYICLTYNLLIPYLWGFYNLVDRWREERNAEGWKEEGFLHQDILDSYLFKGIIDENEYDKLIKL